MNLKGFLFPHRNLKKSYPIKRQKAEAYTIHTPAFCPSFLLFIAYIIAHVFTNVKCFLLFGNKVEKNRQFYRYILKQLKNFPGYAILKNRMFQHPDIMIQKEGFLMDIKAKIEELTGKIKR